MKRKLDNELVSEFRVITAGNHRVMYIEEVVVDGSGTVAVIRSVTNFSWWEDTMMNSPPTHSRAYRLERTFKFGNNWRDAGFHGIVMNGGRTRQSFEGQDVTEEEAEYIPITMSGSYLYNHTM